MPQRAVLTVTRGPNQDDAISLDTGSCRLIGRHLSDNETVMIDRDGNRLLDGQAARILTSHLKDRAPATGVSPVEGFSVNAFERGPDVILADDSISRAHAMIFLDTNGLGVIDLASTNGTFINNDRIGSALAKDGDVLTIGSSELGLQIK
ncbi:MAG: hypothetical protein A2289_27245 [Deltaproteobacteria bacterium RIFOXYA12_FULL_58_15]|nr:MAG: hypothetical protein A2289_27245 [Deltaproteobacteria bacterium RIFOXYA12_FULL_58_15]OGR09918.1 MAG: hypothetical protein A2341_27350 [Deltaproteobacteria bacterium RIFOXYB12_FULL_58_9]